MARQQLNEVSESSLQEIPAAVPSLQPHLVSVESQSERTGLDEPDRTAPSWDKVRILVPGWRGAEPDIIGIPSQFAPWRRRPSLRRLIKRAFDVFGAIVLGLVFLPLMLVITLLLRNEGGAVIYRHRRVGRDGRSFDCLKFRSMVPDAERELRELLERRPELKEEWLRDHKLRDDPRITAIGRFLRRTSLDELPQIWNVLRGDMSLVGPRPIVREELIRYGRCLPLYLSARPGITGLWQVTGRNDTDYRRRVAIDVYYIRSRSAMLDLYILFKTTGVILRGGGAY